MLSGMRTGSNADRSGYENKTWTVKEIRQLVWRMEPGAVFVCYEIIYLGRSTLDCFSWIWIR